MAEVIRWERLTNDRGHTVGYRSGRVKLRREVFGLRLSWRVYFDGELVSERRYRRVTDAKRSARFDLKHFRGTGAR